MQGLPIHKRSLGAHKIVVWIVVDKHNRLLEVIIKILAQMPDEI